MVIVTEKDMHKINNKLAVIIGNIDIGERKGTLKESVVKASEELQQIIGGILDRNKEVMKFFDSEIEEL